MELIRLGLGPEPTPLDYTTPKTLAKSFVARYEYRPDLFAKEVAGIDLDDWQEELLFDIAATVRMITIRSGHGPGKTMTLGLAGIWFLLTRFRCKVVMTAPTGGQLFDALFAETCSILGRCPEAIRNTFEVTSDRIELEAAPDDVFLSARTSSKDKPEALQGIHSDNVLLLADESSGIDDKVFKSAGGSMSGSRVTFIMAGNPTRLLGRFARSHNQKGFRDLHKRFHIGIHNSTRITKEYAESVAVEFGEDSDEYRIRVLGEFAKTDKDSYIPAQLVIDAMERDIAVPFRARPVWALDPARSGKDRFSWGERRGPVVTWIESKRNLDTMMICGHVVAKVSEITDPKDKPVQIMVDLIGIGAGVFDRLNELSRDPQSPMYGITIVGVNVAETPILMEGKAVRLRDELWARYRKWLETRAVKLPEREDLLTDSIAPRYQYLSDGKLLVESKEAMKKRGEASPDEADVVCMLMLAEDSVIYSAVTSKPAAPLKRGLRVMP